MKALTCEMCGSTNLIKKDGVFVCQSCGTQYSVEEAKKMMVEGTVDVKGTVKVDTSDELKNLYEIARRARDSDNNENAAKYYEMILVKDSQSWEAYFYVVYFKAMTCKIEEILSATNSLLNCIKPVLELVRDNVESEDDQKRVIEELKLRLSSAANYLAHASKKHITELNAKIQLKYKYEYYERISAVAHILYLFGDVLELVFPGKYGEEAAYSWKNAIEIHFLIVSDINLKNADRLLREDIVVVIRGYEGKIKKYEIGYKPPESKKLMIPTWAYVVIALIIIVLLIYS